MTTNPTIIVPYRDREKHLKEFVPCILHYLPACKIVVVEQADDKPFNRAKLLNIGVLEEPSGYYAFHDVDKIPLVNCDYSYPVSPRQIAPNPHQTRSYFGGVTLFNHRDFVKVDGFHNEFWGWGGEDNEMMFHIARLGLFAAWKYGKFRDLPHPRPNMEFDPKKWEMAKKHRRPGNGLSSTKYKLVSKERKIGYIHIKAEL